MDHFESLIKTLLEHENWWVQQSYKVELTIEERTIVGRPTMPRPEIDLLAFKHCENEVTAFEVKSFLDTAGVVWNEINIEQDPPPEGRYKLFTCPIYRNVVFERLQRQLIERGMANEQTTIRLGLAAGKVAQQRNQDNVENIANYFNEKGWVFWSPTEIREKLELLADTPYSNNPFVIAAKVLRQ